MNTSSEGMSVCGVYLRFQTGKPFNKGAEASSVGGEYLHFQTRTPFNNGVAFRSCVLRFMKDQIAVMFGIHHAYKQTWELPRLLKQLTVPYELHSLQIC